MHTQLNREIKSLLKLMGRPPRHPRQKNKLNEADGEILKHNSGHLVLNTDIISDEIHWGLYQQPFLVGWMSVVSSLSDISVTGAHPLGVLLGTHWGTEYTEAQRKLFFQGVNAALKRHGTYLLGGDTSFGKETVISSTSVGALPLGQKPILRKKISPGDFVFACGVFGPGPALGLGLLMNDPQKSVLESHFFPKVKFFKNLSFVKASIDVSDGIASSLCILSELNRVSFDIEIPKNLFTKQSRLFCQRHALPISSLFFAEHGDYQPLFVIAPKDLPVFKRQFPKAVLLATARKGSQPHRIKNTVKNWHPMQLDMVYNADKTNVQILKQVFEKWIALAKELQLP